MNSEIHLYDGRVIHVDRTPPCPRCGGSPIEISTLFGAIHKLSDNSTLAYVVLRHYSCREIFVATYKVDIGGWEGLSAKLLSGPPAHYFELENFGPLIQVVSKDFCEIYNEAKHAEQTGLLRICGTAYRKALEFLVKDYLIRHKFVGDLEAANAIVGAPLAVCIDRHIDDKGIRDAAHRAAWLGNDETHYARKWTDKDISDLKDLIAITVQWIALNVRLHGHLKSMPGKKPE